MQFRVLGPVEVESNGQVLQLGSKKQRALLVLLLLKANQPASTDTLVEALWGDPAPPRASATLQVYVSRLRRALEPTRRAGTRDRLLVTTPGGYTLRVGPDDVDAGRFDQLVTAGREALASGNAAEAADLLGQGLSLWRGPAFGEFAEEHFALAEGARLEEARLTAIEDRYDAGLRLGQHNALVGELEQAVAAHPLRERPAGLLMVCLYRAGRQGDALDVFHSTRSALVEELGVEPGVDLCELEASILRHDPELQLSTPREPPTRTVPTTTPPGGGTGWVRPPLPAVVTAGSRVPFVGRETESARLQQAWRECKAGETRFLLVTGEPGIGKSRLVSHFAELVERDGATVLWGRSTEDAVITYQPFAEALAPLAGAILGPLRPDLGSAVACLGRLFPAITTQLPAPSFVARPEVERYLLFDAVNSLLAAAAARGPVVIVLEDLQWADRSSLALLGHLLRHPLAAPVLGLATFRDTEVDDEHIRRDLATEFLREAWAEQIVLDGLAPEGVAALIGAWAGRAAPEDFCRVVAAQTDGNPFYVIETLRDLDESGQPWATIPDRGGGVVTLPATVRTVIEQRLDRLSAGAQETVEVAAVIGRDFDLDLLGHVVDMSEGQLASAIDEAARARLIVDGGSSLGQSSFAHALVRETAYQRLASLRRRQLHRRVGEQLEAQAGAESDDHAATLAHHFATAGGTDGIEKAVAYGREAAVRAANRLAHEEAARRYEEVLVQLGQLSPPQPRLEAESLLGLGDARVRIGERALGRDALVAATAAARRSGDPEVLARAALGVSAWGVQDLWADYGVVAGDTVALLEEALAADPRDAGLRARLTARLAEELYFGDDESRRLALSAEAVDGARRLDDPAVLAAALHSRLRTIWGPDNVAERVSLCTEMLEAATAAGDAELAMTARGRRAANQLEMGAHDEADRDIAVHHRLADEFPHHLQQVWSAGLRIGRHLVAGRFDAAEALINEAAALSPETFASVQAFAGQLCVLRIEQGRAEEMVDVAAAFVDEFPHVPAWRSGLAVLYAEADRLDQASGEVERVAHGLAEMRRDQNWLFAVGALSEACASVDDVALAPVLYDLLLSHADQFVILGDGYALWCSVEQSLGLLAHTMGRTEAAIGHLEQALRVHRAVGARALEVRSDYALGRAYLGRDAGRAQAIVHLGAALDAARLLGMAALVRRSETALAPLGTADGHSSG